MPLLIDNYGVKIAFKTLLNKKLLSAVQKNSLYSCLAGIVSLVTERLEAGSEAVYG
jgi:hypothetical protein